MLITGGPGTGKTTSAAQIIADLVERHPRIRIALAAPTGKAAARLGEAIEIAWERNGLAHLKQRVSLVGKTLHRLLGYNPVTDSFRRGPTDPLEHDVVIVDEASMVPLLLMDALFDALRPSAQLILLGDHDQLASVEAGSVLADIVRTSQTGALHGSVKRLTKSHRFDDTKGIGALARAIRDGDVDGAIAAMQSNDGSVQHVATPGDDDGWLEEFATLAEPVFDAESPQLAIERLAKVRLLCATNVGAAGTGAITTRAEQVLRKRGRDVSGSGYRGRPLLITRNDYTLNLFNGDVGVVWDAIEDGERVERAFVAGQGRASEVRGFPLPQLPEAVTAWAMSIHKSQGSEFDTVYVVLPDRDARVVSRELLYTAVTRARSRVVLVGSEEMLRKAIERTARRGSGLGGRLG
jgi:exodeoxyribonuclease V alpha subunit